MTFKHVNIKYETLEGSEKDFGLVDSKGRKIGYRWKIYKAKSEVVQEARSWITLSWDNTEWFLAHTQATKNGDKFGALTATIYGKTEKEVRDAVQKRMIGAETRYKKQVSA